MSAVQLTKDIDWTDAEAESSAYLALSSAFAHDPLMQLFDPIARDRLAGYVVDDLKKQRNYDGGPLSVYGAGNYVTYVLMPNSLYSVFGKPLASQVGYLVQAHLYPNAYKEASN